MQVLEVHVLKLSKVAVTETTTKSFLRSFCHRCGWLSVLIVFLCGFASVTVHADTVTNAADIVESQLSPMLDSLTEASASAAQSDQIGRASCRERVEISV